MRTVKKVVKQKTPYIRNGIPIAFFAFLACPVLAYRNFTHELFNELDETRSRTGWPIVLWPKPVHELYCYQLKHCTFASRTAMTFVRQKVVIFSRRPTMS